MKNEHIPTLKKISKTLLILNDFNNINQDLATQVLATVVHTEPLSRQETCTRDDLIKLLGEWVINNLPELSISSDNKRDNL